MNRSHFDDATLYAESFANFITSSFFNWVWCFFVIAYTFYWLVKLKWEGIKIDSQLKEAIKIVINYRDHLQFSAAFNEINQRMLRLNKLARAWKEFCQSLLISTQQPEQNEKDQSIIKTSKEVSVFFNDETLIEPSIDLRFFGAIPSHLTGLGILGTFCGLAAGIFLARNGLSAGATDQLQSSLGKLLSGASLAFWTSIIGVLSSLIFSKTEKTLIRNLRHNIDSFSCYLGNKIELVSSEQIADLKLRQHILQNNHLTELINQVEKLYTHQQHVNEKLLRSMAQQFHEALTQSAGSDIKDIASAFKSIHQAIMATQVAISNSGEILEKSSQRASEKFEQNIISGSEYFKNLNFEATEELKDCIKEMSSSLIRSIRESASFTQDQLKEPMSTFLDKINAMSEIVTSNISHVYDSFDSQKKQIAIICESQKNISDVIEPLSKIASQLTSLQRSTQDALIRSSHTAQSIYDAVGKIESIQNNLQSQWDSYCLRFEKVDHHLKNAIEQTSLGLESYSEKVKDFTINLDKQMSKGILSLAGVVGDLNQVVGHIPTPAKEMR